MEVIKYLENATKLNRELQAALPVADISCPMAALETLKDELGIKYSINPLYPELVVLNYCQIDSPKHHPITIECRSLVLEIPGPDLDWAVVSRSFDRFFNYGEVADAGYSAPELVAHEKMDGSLIGLFYYEKYGWLYRTRSMIMPTTSIMGFELTWKDLIEDALGKPWFDAVELCKLDRVDVERSTTFILEVTSPENRIVTRYEGRNMTLLALRDNRTGVYRGSSFQDSTAYDYRWDRPKTWRFETMADCAQGAKDLRELNEGYVMYNRLGEPVCKVKNPAYVAAHHLKSNSGITENWVISLLVSNEIDEYLSIFPEDEVQIKPYIEAYQLMWNHATALWINNYAVTDQKQFALAVKDSSVAPLLFRKKNGVDFSDAFNALTNNSKVSMIKAHLN